MLCATLTWFFFFSSRRRHTRLVSDWSSDVCSSDLNPGRGGIEKTCIAVELRRACREDPGWLHSEPGRRRLDFVIGGSGPGAGKRVARDWPGPLRARDLRQWHRRERRLQRKGPRAVEGDGSTRLYSGRDAFM